MNMGMGMGVGMAGLGALDMGVSGLHVPSPHALGSYTRPRQIPTSSPVPAPTSSTDSTTNHGYSLGIRPYPAQSSLSTSTSAFSSGTASTSTHTSTSAPHHLVQSTSSLSTRRVNTSSSLSSSKPSPTSGPDRTMPPPSTIPRKRKIAPHPNSSPSPSVSPTPDPPEDEDDEYAPLHTTSLPKKTRHGGNGGSASGGAGSGGGGGKGGNGRTMSREALRKANHSMIERRRREKINAALSDLRDMVPGLGGETKGGEFKLEVLERTVAYMRELKATISELESKVACPQNPTSTTKQKASRSKSEAMSEETQTTTTTTTDSSPPKHKTLPPLPAFPQSGRKQHYFANNSRTPPSPSLSPDPNETEPECNLPPAYTLASRQVANAMVRSQSGQGGAAPGGNDSAPGTPTIASLLHTANTDHHRQPSRPAAGPQASNPTLYLPFPTPSPTSPFLTYHTSSSSSNSSGLPEPSPFLAPMQNISLFGGALNLDNSQMGHNEKNGKDMRPEEAANLLLAFSSPDVLRPVAGLQMTPKMIPVEAGAGVMAVGMKRERRGTLDSEEFVLDGGLISGFGKGGGVRNGVIGKTARDILKM